MFLSTEEHIGHIRELIFFLSKADVTFKLKIIGSSIT